MKKITILANADNINHIWNNLGVFESLGIKVIDVIESTGA